MSDNETMAPFAEALDMVVRLQQAEARVARMEAAIREHAAAFNWVGRIQTDIEKKLWAALGGEGGG